VATFEPSLRSPSKAATKEIDLRPCYGTMKSIDRSVFLIQFPVLKLTAKRLEILSNRLASMTQKSLAELRKAVNQAYLPMRNSSSMNYQRH